MKSLVKGSKSVLTTQKFTVTFAGNRLDKTKVDILAVLLGPDKRVRRDEDLVFFNNPNHAGVALVGISAVNVDLGRVPNDVTRIVIAGSTEAQAVSFGQLKDPAVAIEGADGQVLRFEIGRMTSETVVQLVAFYRRDGQWRLDAVGQGYEQGLAAFAIDHGIDVAEPQPTASLPGTSLEKRTKTAPGLGSNDGRPSARHRLAGKKFRNLGIEVELLDVSITSSIRLNTSGYRNDSGYESYTKVEAGAGAKYVTVATRLLNDSQGSIDLTCGYPVATHILDTRKRRFDCIEKLYTVPGNPACNFGLQPGFEAEMTWIYRVPVAAEVRSWEFSDVTDFDTIGRNSPTIVELHGPTS